VQGRRIGAALTAPSKTLFPRRLGRAHTLTPCGDKKGDPDVIDQAGTAVIAATAVWLFFRIVESNWPAAYFSAESRTDPIVNRTLIRYVLWRFGPVFVAAMAVAVTLDRWGYSTLPALTL
jgi:hypothetical protein